MVPDDGSVGVDIGDHTTINRPVLDRGVLLTAYHNCHRSANYDAYDTGPLESSYGAMDPAYAQIAYLTVSKCG